MCGKERFIGPDCRAITLFGFRVRQPGWIGSGLYRRGQAMWEGERVWFLIIYDHQMDRLTCLASWVTGSSWVVLQAQKQSGREKQVVINQGVWFKVLALGPSACPKNARDLTLSKITIHRINSQTVIVKF
jgi:hypothetical protein